MTFYRKYMITVNIFQPLPRLTIGTIVSGNVDNYGWKKKCKIEKKTASIRNPFSPSYYMLIEVDWSWSIFLNPMMNLFLDRCYLETLNDAMLNLADNIV